MQSGEKKQFQRGKVCEGYVGSVSSVSLQPGPPVFILGIRPRSGTNFLWDLLRLHPDLSAPRAPVNEDFLVKHSDHLARYAADVRKHWKKWDRSEDIPNEILASVGRGLLEFM